MALINGIYVFLKEETVDRQYEISSHPVESGEDLVDHVRAQPYVIDINGEIVGQDAAQRYATIKHLADTATPVTYAGRNSGTNLLIQNLSTGHTGEVMGGLTFRMQLVHGRFAKNAYTDAPRQNAGTQQPQGNSGEEKVYYTVKVGDTIWDLVAAPNAPYPTKTYGFTCDDVIEKNPEAFSIPGNPRSMQAGARLWVGNRRQ